MTATQTPSALNGGKEDPIQEGIVVAGDAMDIDQPAEYAGTYFSNEAADGVGTLASEVEGGGKDLKSHLSGIPDRLAELSAAEQASHGNSDTSSSGLSPPPNDLPDSLEDFFQQQNRTAERSATDPEPAAAAEPNTTTTRPASPKDDFPQAPSNQPADISVRQPGRLQGMAGGEPPEHDGSPPAPGSELVIHVRVSNESTETELAEHPVETVVLKTPTQPDEGQTRQPTVDVAMATPTSPVGTAKQPVSSADTERRAGHTPGSTEPVHDSTEKQPNEASKAHVSSDMFDNLPAPLRLPTLKDDLPRSLASSLSAMAEQYQSELSSVPSLVSSKATTPADTDISPEAVVPSQPIKSQQQQPTLPALSPSAAAAVPATTSVSMPVSPAYSQLTDRLHYTPRQRPSSQPSTPQTHLFSDAKRVSYKVKPKASIPTNMPLQAYANQCIAAAESSRLNPYALHAEEHVLLREHISHSQVTTYLNIRNGIVRLWLRRPMHAIKREDAIGCARDRRWFDAASICFDWLVRRGYVNYGCVENGIQHGDDQKPVFPLKKKRRRRIVVIGAGMAGLGCARQLENLFTEYADQFRERDEEPPEVLVLEGRSRIGGRVYSRAFLDRPQGLPRTQTRATAEMGGMIITGFDRGNPMNVLVRGQLGLEYHALVSETTLYDIDGKPVNAERDGLVEDLFNECLDRVSEYKFELPVNKVVEGNQEFINEGRDTSSSHASRKTLAQVEDAAAAQAAVATKSTPSITGTPKTVAPPMASQSPALAPAILPASGGPVSVSSDRTVVRSNSESERPENMKAAYRLKMMGWGLKSGVAESRDLNLDPPAQTPGATLGYVVEEAIEQYRDLVDLNAQDLRLLNWHIANMEYSNAINQNKLSLQGWDIDTGNEWDGKHSMVVGGYQSVPKGLMMFPTPLKLQRQMVVKKIISSTSSGADDSTAMGSETKNGNDDNTYPMKVECEDGHVFEADYVVNTIPLGVLKDNTIEFDPPLPTWKTDAIQRLGYGVLNKIVLTFERPFWDTQRDIFGILRAPNDAHSLDQKEYSQNRGRMFQWFNVTKSTNIPCLVALMAGDAAYAAENSKDDVLVSEALSVLRSVFGSDNVPMPIESIVTRWASDRFARGSYSSAGPEMRIDDYDTMARPIGRRHIFAGEHTIGTHPATVHGAYLSGLRAASDLIDELLGPIQVPTPLIVNKEMAAAADTLSSLKRKFPLDNEPGTATGGEESSSSFGGIHGSPGHSHREAKARLRRQLEAYEQEVQEHIVSTIGFRPQPPSMPNHNAYQLFRMANYERVRKQYEEFRRPSRGRSSHEAGVLISKMWRSASDEERRPFFEAANRQKQAHKEAVNAFSGQAADWERKAAVSRAAYEKEHPRPTSILDSIKLDNNNNNKANSAVASPTSSVRRRRLLRTTSQKTEGESDVDMTE